jgi:hypothetical protein
MLCDSRFCTCSKKRETHVIINVFFQNQLEVHCRNIHSRCHPPSVLLADTVMLVLYRICMFTKSSSQICVNRAAALRGEASFATRSLVFGSVYVHYIYVCSNTSPTAVPTGGIFYQWTDASSNLERVNCSCWGTNSFLAPIEMTGATQLLEEASLRLSSGLRVLRSQGTFCDVVLSSGADQCFAHQAVLAALSKPLRDYILASSKGQAPPCPELSAPPQALEIKLENTSLDSKAVQAFIGQAYGEEIEDCAVDISDFAAAFKLGKLDAAELTKGLQTLQAQGLLCDILLSAGGEHMPAHQVVLASASSALRGLIMDGMEELGIVASGEKAAAATTHTLELELRGVESAEAVRVLLDFLYGRPLLANRKLSAEACRDVLHLASELCLPSLQDQGLLWSRSCKQAVAEKDEPPAAEDEGNEAEDATAENGVGSSSPALPVVEEAQEEAHEEEHEEEQPEPEKQSAP